MAVTTVNGNIVATPHVTFHLMNGPSNYHYANNKSYGRANDHDDRANNACELLRPRRLLRR